MEITAKSARKIGLIGWVAIALSSLTLLAAALLIYLIVTTEPPPPKVVQQEVVDPNLVAPESDGRYHLTLKQAALTGESLALESRGIGEVIGGLKSTADRVSWRLNLKKAGIYEIHYTYSNPQEKGTPVGKIRFTCNGETITTALRGTGGVLNTVTDRVFLKLEPAGEVTLELSAAADADAELCAIRKVDLTPKLRERRKT